MVAAVLAAAIAAGAGATDRTDPARVLMIDSFGHENSSYQVFSTAFRAELARRAAAPLAFYETSLDAARFVPARDAEPFVRFLRERFAAQPPDLVVPIGPPAARFYAQFRDQLFPGVPMLVAVTEERVLRSIAFAAGDAYTSIAVDLVALVDNVLQLLPNTKRIVFVLGNSAIEQFWVRVVRDELKRFEGRVAIEIPHTLSLEQLEQQVSALPSDAAVFFAQIYVDGANVSREQHVTLARLRAASRVPIFGLYESQFGNGIVGGPLISEKAVAVMTADIAARMVDGRALTPGPRTLPLGVPIYDARELSRWSIPDSRLPQPQEVRFRMPTLWQQYRWQIVAAASLLVLQSLLLVGLLLQRARRRRAEQEARQLNGRILGAQEEERRRLGRELHDDVTPRLARLAIEARRLQGPALVAQGFPMHDELVRLSEDVHAFSYRLHPTVLDDLGLVDALQAECDRWARGQQLQVLFSARDVAESPATETATALFRIAQESLRNANRHAQARRVDVTLAPQDGGLRLSVHDDGIGIDDGAIDTQPGLGLASMHARAHQVGGWLQILGEPGAGTTVIAWVPARASA